MAQNTTKNDVENRLKDMFVKHLQNSQDVIELVDNVRRAAKAEKASPQSYLVDCEMRNELPPYPQYGGTVTVTCETRADGSANFEGDTDRSVVERMAGQVREAFGQFDEDTVPGVSIVEKLNRLDRRIVIHEDGLKERETLRDDNGAIRRQVVEFEVHCYAP